MESSRASRCSQDQRKNYFGKIKFVLKLVGVPLEGNESVAYNVYSFLLILFVNCLFTFFNILELFQYDLEEVLGMAEFPIAYILVFAKLMVVMRSRIKLGKLLKKLEQEPFIPNLDRGGEIEEKLVDNCLWIINAQALVYWGSVIAGVSIAAMLTLIPRIRSSDYRDWQFPYGPMAIVNVTYSPNYELSWLYQNISMTIMAIQFTFIDFIPIDSIVYVTFQFKILQNNIKRIVEISYEEMLKDTAPRELSANHNSKGFCQIDPSMVPWKYIKKSLARFVNYHLAVISIADEMEDVFSGLLLFTFLGILGILAIAISHPTPITTNGIIATAGDIFAYCFWGEQILYHSQEVGRAAFEANWVGADLRFQKSLLLITRRSQKPTVITTKKFAVVGMATYTWILRTSYSASALLRQIKQK